MLRIHFTAADLVHATIAAEPDPLWEIVLSRFRLDDRHRPVTYRPWMLALSATTRSRAQPLRVLRVLAPRGPYIPDFLTPNESCNGLAAGLDAVRSTPRNVLRGQLERLATTTPLPAWVQPLAEGNVATLHHLTGTLHAYYDMAIAPHEAIVRQSIAADHACRIQHLTASGLDGLFASMSPTMRWRPPVLEVDYRLDRDLHLDGRGLRLVPSYFCDRVPVALADPELPPVLIYPIAQQFKWAHATRPARPKALDILLGGTRSAVLQSIHNGATTTQLARRLDTSIASVSRHATALRDAGLVTSHRQGAAVLHSLTPLGVAILDNG
jgi:DNA-binding transcriptional ArsR family regulator